ncbi:MAG: SH3 domain-containing protein [Bacteroidetes Order II. Incertae sedis bacterium]|nr:SH3 domain-containing protein [Bacteroidetes Order II. bacterium]
MLKYFLLCVLFASSVQAQTQWIVIGSNIRVRQASDVSATELGKLGLGVIVVQKGKSVTKTTIGGKTDFWYQISTPTLTGWVFGAFLKPYVASQKQVIYMELVRSRLATEATNFLDEADLVVFTERAIREIKSPPLVGELEMSRLLALKRAAPLMLMDTNTGTYPEPYKSWAQRHEAKSLFYDEISAQYLLKPEVFWNLATKYKNAAIGERIAWEASQVPLGGECEGDLSCNLGYFNVTIGEYLRRYPKGVHVKEALNQVSEWLSSILQLEEPYINEVFYPGQRKDFQSTYDAFRRAVNGTVNPIKAEVLDLLSQIDQKVN